MKTLLLMRHAKSSWDDPALGDFDRPLNGRGLKAAPFMGRVMRRRGEEMAPQLIVCSPALRAKQTAELVIQAARFDAPLQTEERVYEAVAGVLLEVIAETDRRVGRLMLIGHNPGLEGVLGFLTGRRHTLSTAALAVVHLDIAHWAEVFQSHGTLETLLKPKELMK